MTIGDFFEFDPNEYAERITVYDTDRLRKQEVVKTRQRFAGGNSIMIGAGAAPFTLGGTLAVSAYGGRRLYVARKKLELIRLELQKRNVELHQRQKRDFLIPLAASAVGLGIGFGLDEVASAATNTVPMATHIPTGSSMFHEVVNNPGDVVQGLGAGVTEQTHEMATALTNMGAGVIPGSDLSSEVLAASTVWTVAPSQAEAVGFYLGMLLAQGVEHSVAGLIGAQSAYLILECMGGHAKAAKTSQICPRTLGGLGLACDSCTLPITGGWYWHCCDCIHQEVGHNFDLCHSCYAAKRRCPNKAHSMKTLQVALDVDYVPSTPPPAYGSLSVLSLKSVGRGHLGNAGFGTSCNECLTRIVQGSWFHCPECGDYDLCRDCYRASAHCPGRTHSLEVRTVALDCRKSNTRAKDCKDNAKNQTVARSCALCSEKIQQGRIYHCCNCNGNGIADNFYLCHACYKSGSRCSCPASHTLQVHMAGLDSPKQPYSSPGALCSRCRELPSKESYFYHCNTCDKGTFDICSPCYAVGKGCNDPAHMMSRHFYKGS